MNRQIRNLFLPLVTLTAFIHGAEALGQRGSLTCEQILRENRIGNEAAKVLKWFGKIADLDRPSGKETTLRDLIKEVVRQENARGKQLRIVADRTGNLLLRKRGTGKFRNSTNWVALQVHMDMQQTVTDAVADKEEYFRSGIPLESTDGVVHSRDFQSTIGADNGVGVAVLLNLLTTDDVEHGPLELIFTVQEETTFQGVFDFGFPLAEQYLINLDSSKYGDIVMGCAGAAASKLSTDLESTPVNTNSVQLVVDMSGLLMGHSGLDVRAPRVNPVRLVIQMLNHLKTEVPQLGLIEGESSNTKSQIAGAFKFKISLPKDREAYTRALLHRLWTEALAQASDENPDVAKIEISTSRDQAPRAVQGRALDAFLSALSKIPNGPIEPLGTKLVTSGNMGNFVMTPSSFSADYLLRSQRRSALDQEVGNLLWLPLKVDVEDREYPWVGREGKLLQTAQRVSALFHTKPFEAVETHGILELLVFSRKYPDMEMISLAPTHILDEHAPTERFEIAPLETFIPYFHTLLGELAKFEP